LSKRAASAIESGVRATARCLIVAITISSWIAISNHCAFRGFVTKTNTTESGCPLHSKPAKPQPQSGGTECCKILRAVSTTPAKILAPATFDLLHIDLAFDRLAIFPPPKISFLPATLDTGPPGAFSFAELILQRSILSHAPPVLA
jgi:hypothetical protein